MQQTVVLGERTETDCQSVQSVSQHVCTWPRSWSVASSADLHAPTPCAVDSTSLRRGVACARPAHAHTMRVLFDPAIHPFQPPTMRVPTGPLRAALLGRANGAPIVCIRSPQAIRDGSWEARGAQRLPQGGIRGRWHISRMVVGGIRTRAMLASVPAKA